MMVELFFRKYRGNPNAIDMEPEPDLPDACDDIEVL